MNELAMFGSYLTSIGLFLYAAVVASQQYQLPWLPALVGGACALHFAASLSRGIR